MLLVMLVVMLLLALHCCCGCRFSNDWCEHYVVDALVTVMWLYVGRAVRPLDERHCTANAERSRFVLALIKRKPARLWGAARSQQRWETRIAVVPAGCAFERLAAAAASAAAAACLLRHHYYWWRSRRRGSADCDERRLRPSTADALGERWRVVGDLVGRIHHYWFIRTIVCR